MKILMVEDERYMAEAVQHVLKRNNYNIDLAYDGESGLDLALTAIYDVIILDIMLPKKDGIDVLKELRSNNVMTPVIMLTAKGEVNDKILGLDNGADDYLAKPFVMDELMARLRALGRRKDNLSLEKTLSYEDIELNPNTLVLKGNNKEFKLTLKESQLLELLLNRAGKIVSKDTIFEHIWGYDADAVDNNIEVYVSMLRKKISHLKSKAQIKTVRGAGYMLIKDVKKDV